MKPFVLALSGRMASGKSTLALRLAELLGCARASFGDYVRTLANSRGIEPTGENLQSVGAELVESGWERFCRAVLSQSSWQPGQMLVVDGVRHVDAIPHLKSLVAPLSIVLVHVKIDEELRIDRIRERQVTAAEPDTRSETHSTEVDVKVALPALADLVVDGSRPVGELANEIVEFAGQHVSIQAAPPVTGSFKTSPSR